MESKTKSIFSKLPFDLIKEVLLFDSHFVQRRNKTLVLIDKIPKNDYRYQLCANIPKIKGVGSGSDSCFSVTIWKQDKIYFLHYYLRPSLIWEYNFVVYSREQHTKRMNSVPYSLICIPRY